MITEQQFEQLLQNTESSILDFKVCMYDFTSDADGRKTAAFLKDILSFCNTVRATSAYIIFGVEIAAENKKLLHGLDVIPDDGLLQDKIKDKAYPRPHFQFSVVHYQNKSFGIIEIPVRRYELPPTSAVKLKGLEIGKVYYRYGSTNTEAKGAETIHIHEWMKNLPVVSGADYSTRLNELLVSFTASDIKLSILIAQLYTEARKGSSAELMAFCVRELQGLNDEDRLEGRGAMAYRLQQVFISPHQVELTPSYFDITPSLVKQEFRRSPDFYEHYVLFSQPITAIETLLERFKEDPLRLGSLKFSARNFIPAWTGKEIDVYAYLFHDTVLSLYQNIRQKAIDLIISAPFSGTR